MQAELISEEGLLKGLALPLPKGKEWTLGRDPEQSAVVIEDPSISRLHGKITENNGVFTVENLSESSFIKINDQEVSSPSPLQNNDLLQMGDRIFRFVVSDSPTQEEIKKEETLVEETSVDEKLPEINFNVNDSGRFLLKVISGPNLGAEFYMHLKESFILGVDPKSADIVFNDTSISRQHATISVDEEGVLSLEDLKSKNGTFIDGVKITGKNPLSSNQIVSLGTTSFVVYDREGEMHTILSPLLPSIVKMLQKEEPKEQKKEENPEGEEAKTEPLPNEPTPPVDPITPPAPKTMSNHHLGVFVIIAFVMALFVSVGFGVYTLFQSQPIVQKEEKKEERAIEEVMQNYPSVRANYNKAIGKVFLIGHLLTDTDKNQLLYALQSLKFLRTIDDSGIIIDEYVWREMNQVLAKRSQWKGVSFYSPSPGKFVVTGYLKTRLEADALNDYINSNFLYISLLDNQIVVEEEMISSIREILRTAGFPNVQVQINSGEITLTGQIPPNNKTELEEAISKLKKVSGVKSVSVDTSEKASNFGTIDLSSKYSIGGVTRLGTKLNVLISGKILNEGDYIDGMKITSITNNKVLLEKDNSKYEINF